MYQVMQSVKVTNEALEHHGQAGYVVGDKTTLVNGVWQGKVEVKIDADNEVYEFECTDITAL